MSSHISIDQVRSIDRELARVARGAGALRLRIGEALEALASRGWHHELGFSSLDAYSLERCVRSGRWAAEARAMGRRLAALPRIRGKLAAGALGWSMAELLARHGTAETERELVDQAARCTVRAMRSQLSEPRPTEDDEPELRTLELTVDREDCWLADCTRLLVAHVGGRTSPDETLQALLAEGLSSLVELLPHGTLADLEADLEGEAEGAEPHGRARSAERDAVEERSEAGLDLTMPMTPAPMTPAAPNGPHRVVSYPDFVAHEQAYASPEALDAHIRSLSAELAERDLAIGLMARALRRADGWRRLGFVTEAQYARERLGISLSSLKARLALARSAEWLPGLDAALVAGRIGYVAATLIARIATLSTLGDWIERAAERTTKHLREEVEAAELFVRLESRREQPPPAEETMRELAEARRRATVALATLAGVANRRSEESGQRRRGKGVRPSADRNAPASLLAPEGQMSGGGGETVEAPQGQMSVGRVETADGARPLLELPPRDPALGSFGAFGRATLRFTVRRETHALYRAVEGVFERHRALICEEPIGLLHFLCVSFWRVWGTTLDPKVAYAAIYARDGHECTSPVCTRRDLTPHHLWFRGKGGPDEPWNVTSLCVWCHLLGVHQGRIIALPPSSRIQWRIGRTGAVVVDGRRKLAA